MIPLLLVLTIPPGHLVHLNPEQIYAWGLPPSIDDKYKVFSFNEFKDIRIAELQLLQLSQESTLIKDKLKETTSLVESLELEVALIKDTRDILQEQADRRERKLGECSVALKEEQESVFPVVALSVGGSLAAVGIILISVAVATSN